MRILKVTGGYPPATAEGGTAVAAHELCQALRRRGNEVDVLTTDSDGASRLPIGRGWTTLDGVPVRYCRRLWRPLPYYSPELVQTADRILSSYDIVLLDAAWVLYGVSVGKLCVSRRVPYIVYAHGSHAAPRLARGPVRRWAWWHLFDRRLYARASACIALTAREKEDLRSMGVQQPIWTIPNGVEPGRSVASRATLEARWPALQGRRYVLFLGRLERVKGLDLLVPAFARIASTLPNLVLVIAGPDEDGYREHVQTALQAANAADRALLAGPVTGDLKWGLLSEAALFVLPSYAEGFSMALLEALAAGTPAVVTTECNFPQLATAGAGSIVDASIPELAEAMRTILSEPDLAHRMGRAARQLVETRFAWDEVARRTIDACRITLQHDQRQRSAGAAEQANS